MMTVTTEAWAQPQVFSKLWLLRELEPRVREILSPVIWILGGWYGILPFMLWTRGIISPRRIVSFDIDPDANSVAGVINKSWEGNPDQFQTVEMDCVNLEYSNNPAAPKPDIVINTACEHFSSNWAKNLPAGVIVAIQSTDMVHEEHLFGAKSLADFQEQFSIFSEILFSGSLPFKYPGFEFTRYMIIGRR